MYDLNEGTLEEFQALQDKLDIQTYRDFEELRREGEFFIENAPLGALLTLLNYYPGDDTDIEEYLMREIEEISAEDVDYLHNHTREHILTIDAILKKDLEAKGVYIGETEHTAQLSLFVQKQSVKDPLALPYGFRLSDPALLIQDINIQKLEEFIAQWYAAQPEEKRWNPAYAPFVELRPEVVEFCRTHSVRDILNEFTLFRKKSSSYGPPLLTETFLDYFV